MASTVDTLSGSDNDPNSSNAMGQSPQFTDSSASPVLSSSPSQNASLTPSQQYQAQLQSQIEALLASAKEPDGEYNMIAIGQVFGLYDQVYNAKMSDTSDNMDTIADIQNNLTEMQNAVDAKDQVSEAQANTFSVDMQAQTDTVQKLVQDGVMNTTTATQIYTVIHDLAEKFFGDNATANLQPSANGPGIDWSQIGTPTEVQSFIKALWAANQGQGTTPPPAAAQTALSDVNQDFTTFTQTIQSANTNQQSIYSFQADQDKQYQTAEYNFWSFLQNWITAMVGNQKVNS